VDRASAIDPATNPPAGMPPVAWLSRHSRRCQVYPSPPCAGREAPRSSSATRCRSSSEQCLVRAHWRCLQYELRATIPIPPSPLPTPLAFCPERRLRATELIGASSAKCVARSSSYRSQIWVEHSDANAAPRGGLHLNGRDNPPVCWLMASLRPWGKRRMSRREMLR